MLITHGPGKVLGLSVDNASVPFFGSFNGGKGNLLGDRLGQPWVKRRRGRSLQSEFVQGQMRSNGSSMWVQRRVDDGFLDSLVCLELLDSASNRLPDELSLDLRRAVEVFPPPPPFNPDLA